MATEVETEVKEAGETQEEEEEVVHLSKEEEQPVERLVVWTQVVKFSILHCLALYGLTLLPSVCPATIIFLFLTYLFSALGTTAGNHRLWAHKSYKAKLPLQVFLIIANSMGGQNSAYDWSRDHRLHHRGSETNADPHNANRGFFFAHIGWLMVRKHPAVKSAGKKLDMSDLERDPLIMFQHRHCVLCFLLVGALLPTVVPHLLWGETLTAAYFMAVVRYVSWLHFTFLVNSAAHMFGMKPYDKNIGPSENRLVSFLAVGEGFHNYHHTFPYDYRTSEWGLRLNVTTGFINLMAWMGQAYDLRSASPAMVAARAARTGTPALTKQGIRDKAC